MSVITLKGGEIKKEKGMVILPVAEYEALIRKSIPTIRLYGKEARKLDRLVDEGIKEYARGKTRKIKSLSDLK